MNFSLIIKHQNMVKIVKLCYMNTGSFIVHVKTDDIYKDIAQYVEKRFDTSNYEIDRPLPKGKNEKLKEFLKN